MILQVGADLSTKGYLETIAQATDDILVQLIFNNAGYMLSGLFESRWVSTSLTLNRITHSCMITMVLYSTDEALIQM